MSNLQPDLSLIKTLVLIRPNTRIRPDPQPSSLIILVASLSCMVSLFGSCIDKNNHNFAQTNNMEEEVSWTLFIGAQVYTLKLFTSFASNPQYMSYCNLLVNLIRILKSKYVFCIRLYVNEILVPRVMEVSSVYGLNLTYEAGRDTERGDSFFKCSLTTCHLNGECIVQVRLTLI